MSLIDSVPIDSQLKIMCYIIILIEIKYIFLFDGRDKTVYLCLSFQVQLFHFEESI
jgi:hypothetical protein